MHCGGSRIRTNRVSDGEIASAAGGRSTRNRHAAPMENSAEKGKRKLYPNRVMTLPPSSAAKLPISEAVIETWATLVADCKAAGIHRTVKLTDALIAATAVERGLPVVTQDDDYEQLARAHPALHVHRV